MKDKVYDNLKSAGVMLPETSLALGSYVPCKQVGALLFVSGQVSKKNNALITGKITEHSETSMAKAREAAYCSALNILAVARASLGSLDRIQSVVKLGGFVCCSNDFTAIPVVINAASDLMIQAFGKEMGEHARFAVGASSLPRAALVEIEAIFEIKK